MTDEPVQLTTEGVSAAGLDYNGMRCGDVAELRARLNEVQAENVHLRGLLRLTPEQARQPGPSQTAIFDKSPGPVSGSSELHAKVPFYARLFRARQDVYAVRWDNGSRRARQGLAGAGPDEVALERGDGAEDTRGHPPTASASPR